MMQEAKDVDPDLYDSASIDFTADSTTVGDLTPTHSVSMADEFEDYLDSSLSDDITSAPWPGNTYIIRDPDSRQQVTLVRGQLRLARHLGNQGGYHWECIEKDGWLGFRSPSDHLHIGHDNRRNFIATAKDHRPWEYFNTRAHPKGGHILLVVHGWQQWKMTIAKDGHSLIETLDEGTAWEFKKV
ncbi:hypothetical protein F4820DRAFT_432844 [Hypoxylon rubiginosum]|uniref:Uncharacterized protein n=1 Tax=Hypoxylon rubiginosum TaxID=110542 RepID=A0ACB9YSD8_9PEZI|nr:hypothetical protein F4820DRAFT_432844 [Hypoxylon rubiginosum]